MKNDKQEKIELRQLLVEREYEYQNNLKNNSSSLYSNVKLNIYAIIIGLIAGLFLYFTYDSNLHISIKIISGFIAFIGVLYLLAMLFSKMLWLYLVHYITTFILDLLFVIILLPRTIFGKKKNFEKNANDEEKIYSDII